MRAIAYILMCCASLMAMAQGGWSYNGTRAIIVSEKVYLDGYDSMPTGMSLVVDVINAEDYALIGLYGGSANHDFFSSQMYVTFEFDRIDEPISKWGVYIPDFEFKHSAAAFTQPTKLIERLRNAEWFEISVPVRGHGIVTFHFNTHGYPLVKNKKAPPSR